MLSTLISFFINGIIIFIAIFTRQRNARNLFFLRRVGLLGFSNAIRQLISEVMLHPDLYFRSSSGNFGGSGFSKNFTARG
jgi:hypothetical protein